MSIKLKPVINRDTDVLILGGGGAGLRAAIAAREKGVEVLLVSKSRAGYGNNTAIAGGAFAAAGGWREPRDNPQVHKEDTMRGGHFINNPRLVEVMAQGGAQQVYDLERFGVHFVKMEGAYRVGQVPGHIYPRHVACVERIGAGLSLPLRRHALDKGASYLEGAIVTQLLKKDGTVTGAVGVDETGQAYCLRAKATILATGGLGQIYQRTNNALEATGDGYALAYEAGAPLQDMEFVQFYPTCFQRRGAILGLVLYEYLVFMGGAAIRNSLGQDILEVYGLRDPLKMTRDRLAQAIMREVKAGRSYNGLAHLDLTSIAEPRRERYRAALPKGASYEQGTVPVTPGVHYTMGGIQINERTETPVDGLYAAGEVCGGIQGANRLAGNALTDCFVFGAIAGERAAQRAKTAPKPEIDSSAVKEELARLQDWLNKVGTEKVPDLLASLKKTMWDKVGVLREEADLVTGLSELAALRQALGKASADSPKEWLQALRLDKMLTVSEMVARSALMRQESRGAHYRSDHPEERNPAWLCNIVVRQKGTKMELATSPISPLPDEIKAD